MEETTEHITRLIIQLAVILIAAKLSGEVCERFLKLPAVLGELAAGIIIGPFALGGWDLPAIGALFEHPAQGISIPVSEGLWSIAQVGSVVLLFVAGIETNLSQFLRYAKPASIVAVGGMLFPFALGVLVTVWFGYADRLSDVGALFIGAVLTATSIGITVRVLSDIRKLDTPEGMTILGAAVLDDILGILTLTLVVGLHETTNFSATTVGLVAFKTIGFWVALTGLGILLSKHISTFFLRFRVSGAALALALSLAFLSAGMAESFGLAMIIGAFSIGLALSGTELAKIIMKPLESVYDALVPIFFVCMGMLVDISLLDREILGFGLVITLVAVVAKVAGAGLPAFLAGFNKHGIARIGVGMLPRGEVALIMAGIGISKGIISQDLYSVAILMTIITTALAPPLLAILFKQGSQGTNKNSSLEIAQ